jgi:hypothetical protein
MRALAVGKAMAFPTILTRSGLPAHTYLVRAARLAYEMESHDFSSKASTRCTAGPTTAWGPDGESFYMVREFVNPSLNVAVNWFDELRERVPVS